MPEFLDKKKLDRGGLRTKVSRWEITSLTTLKPISHAQNKAVEKMQNAGSCPVKYQDESQSSTSIFSVHHVMSR